MEMLSSNSSTLSPYQQKRKKWHEEWKKRCREIDKMYERVEIDGVIYTRPRKTEKKAVYKPPVNKNPKKRLNFEATDRTFFVRVSSVLFHGCHHLM